MESYWALLWLPIFLLYLDPADTRKTPDGMWATWWQGLYIQSVDDISSDKNSKNAAISMKTVVWLLDANETDMYEYIM